MHIYIGSICGKFHSDYCGKSLRHKQSACMITPGSPIFWLSFTIKDKIECIT